MLSNIEYFIKKGSAYFSIKKSISSIIVRINFSSSISSIRHTLSVISFAGKAILIFSNKLVPVKSFY